jgi:hypothetical protein
LKAFTVSRCDNSRNTFPITRLKISVYARGNLKGGDPMTEAEMMTKWCPKARVLWTDSTTYGASYNRDSDGSMPVDCLCLGQDCAAWRWSETTPERLTSDTEVIGWDFIAAADSDTGADLWREPLVDAAARRNGYCGAFGEVLF